MQSIGRFSYLVLSILILAGLGWMAITDIANRTVWVLSLIGALALLLVIWVAARRGESPPSPEKRLRRTLGAGRPVVLHFYSDYDLFCMVKRARTAAIEKAYRGRIDFVHVSLTDPAGDALAEQQKAGLGSFVLFDASGQEVTRPSLLTRQVLVGLLERPAPSTKR